MTLLTGIGSFLKKALDGLKTIAKIAFTFGNDLVNAVKAFEATPVGQEVTGVIDTIAGAVIPPTYLNAFKTWFPTFIKDMGWIQTELSKTDDEIVHDFSVWFNGLVNPDAKASVAHILNANVTKFISDQMGSGLTIQQGLTMPQYVYNPDLFEETAPDLTTNTVASAPAVS